MNRYQYRTWSTFNSIKTLFGYRNQHYQPVEQIETEESKYFIDGNTSCMEDKTLIENDKLSLGDHVDHINMKQIDEFLPLITEKSFNLKLLVPPVSAYTTDTRPDVDLLEC